jgi:hypothetical protein
MSTEYERGRRRPPFGLYDTFLEAERDAVYEHMAIRLKWFGEDCLRASERIKAEPRYGLEMIEHLSTTVQQLDKIAGSAQAKEEMLRQAMSWRVASDDLLPNHLTLDDVLRDQTVLGPGPDSAFEEKRRPAEDEAPKPRAEGA